MLSHGVTWSHFVSIILTLSHMVSHSLTLIHTDKQARPTAPGVRQVLRVRREANHNQNTAEHTRSTRSLTLIHTEQAGPLTPGSEVRYKDP